MSRDVTPILKTRRLDRLLPTQMTIGYREVAARIAEWKGMKKKEAGVFLGGHAIPVVLGPADRTCLIDHHHLARALIDSGQEEVMVQVVADYRSLSVGEFWHMLDCQNYVYTFDAQGRKHAPSDLPGSLLVMPDDPFRSLAGAVRRNGGFAKDRTPYAEFIWSDFFRRRIGDKLVERDFDRALGQATDLARSGAARHLPGWCGPDT